MDKNKVYRFKEFINETLTFDSVAMESPYRYKYNSDNNQEYRDILDQLGVTSYIIEENGEVDVHGNVDLSGKLKEFGYKYVPVKFRRIYGNFNVSNNDLDDFVRFPKQIDGTLDISNNKFKYLYDKTDLNIDKTNFINIDGDLIVKGNPLKTLKRFFTVKGDIISNINDITNPLDKMKPIRQKLINKGIIKRPKYHWADRMERESKMKRNSVDADWFKFVSDFKNTMINNNRLHEVPESAWLNFTVTEWDSLFRNQVRGIYKYWDKYGYSSEVLDYNDIDYIVKKYQIED